MRIIDEVKLGRFEVHPSVENIWNTRKVHLSLDDAVPVDISSVREWAENEWKFAKNEGTTLRLMKLFTGTRLSFRSTWFEWKVQLFYDGVKTDARAVWVTERDDEAWEVHVFDRQDRTVFLTHVFCLSPEKFQDGKFVFFMAEADPSLAEKRFISGVSVTVLLAQTLMHCKNIRVERQGIPPRLAKSFERKHGSRPTVFHQVVIDPMREIVRRAGGIQHIGVERAMHIVRGNFAEYTEEKPLFGRIAGRFFRPQHIRGNAEVGKKTPDYSVRVK